MSLSLPKHVSSRAEAIEIDEPDALVLEPSACNDVDYRGIPEFPDEPELAAFIGLLAGIIRRITSENTLPPSRLN